MASFDDRSIVVSPSASTDVRVGVGTTRGVTVRPRAQSRVHLPGNSWLRWHGAFFALGRIMLPMLRRVNSLVVVKSRQEGVMVGIDVHEVYLGYYGGDEHHGKKEDDAEESAGARQVNRRSGHKDGNWAVGSRFWSSAVHNSRILRHTRCPNFVHTRVAVRLRAAGLDRSGGRAPRCWSAAAGKLVACAIMARQLAALVAAAMCIAVHLSPCWRSGLLLPHFSAGTGRRVQRRPAMLRPAAL